MNCKLLTEEYALWHALEKINRRAGYTVGSLITLLELLNLTLEQTEQAPKK